MKFTIVDNSEYQTYLDNIENQYKHHENSLMLYSVSNKHEFNNNQPSKKTPILTYLNIIRYNTHKLSYENTVNHEVFTIQQHLVDISYITTINPQFDVNRLRIMISVSDFLKYYYYQHRDHKNYGLSLNDYDPETIKNMVEILESNTIQSTKPNLGRPFYETASNVSRYRYTNGHTKKQIGIIKVKDYKNNWTRDFFLSQGILVDITKINNDSVDSIAHKLLNFYLYGYFNTQSVEEKEIIEFENPRKIADIIRKYEDIKLEKIHNFLKKIEQKPKPSEQFEIDKKYPEYVVDCYLSDKDMSYPPYAFQQYLFKNWIVDNTINELMYLFDQKERYQKNPVLKHLTKKRGKYLNPGNDPELSHQVDLYCCDSNFMSKKKEEKDKRNMKNSLKKIATT